MSISVSYAYISSSVGKSSSKTDIYGKTECIDVDVTSEVPELTYKYPIEDNFAVGNVKPIKITLHNTCKEEQSPINYSVIITTFADSQTSNSYIPSSKIKTKIDKQVDSNNKVTLQDKVLLNSLNMLLETSSTNTILNNKLDNDNRINTLTYRDSRVIDEGTISNDETIVYETYLWIDYYEGGENNSTKGKSYKSLISVITNNKEDNIKGETGDSVKLLTAIDLTKDENRPRGLSENQLGDMYRFVGTKDAVDNYVCFGYSNAETDCIQGETSDYMYRIIGITPEGQFKLIKNTSLRESDTASDTYYRWWENYTTDINWPESKIFLRLNGKGTNNTAGYTGDSNLFIDSTTSNVNYIKSSEEKGDTTWYNKIEQNHSWWYGGIYSTNANKTANEIYQIETGQLETQQNDGEESAKWPASQKVEAAIGLMYISDYYYYSYAASGTDSSSTICYRNTACKNSWLYISNNGKSVDYQYEWTMTRYGRTGYGNCYAWFVNLRGIMSYDYLDYNGSVRPVFYLTTEASKVQDAKGTSDNPFIIVK